MKLFVQIYLSGLGLWTKTYGGGGGVRPCKRRLPPGGPGESLSLLKLVLAEERS